MVVGVTVWLPFWMTSSFDSCIPFVYWKDEDGFVPL